MPLQIAGDTCGLVPSAIATPGVSHPSVADTASMCRVAQMNRRLSERTRRGLPELERGLHAHADSARSQRVGGGKSRRASKVEIRRRAGEVINKQAILRRTVDKVDVGIANMVGCL